MKKIKTFSIAITMLFCILSFSQKRTITGTVSDKNEPLPFVSIQIKGTQKVTQTDLEGKFSIKAKTGDVLLINYVGFDKFELEIGASINQYQIILNPNINLLDRVPSGCAKPLRNDVALPVKCEEYPKAVEQKDTIKQNEKKGIIFRCRRDSSKYIEPLYIINEKIVSKQNVKNLNPKLIQTIDTIKPKDATALYGNSGMSGAIIVKTKKLSRKQKNELKNFLEPK